MASSATSGAGSYKSGMSRRRKRGSAICRMAMATSRRAALAASSVLLVRSSSVASARSTSSGVELPAIATAAVARMRGSGSARSGRANEAASSWLIADSAPMRRGADARVAIAEHAADVRHPLLGDVAAHGAERRQRAPADLGRLVIEEKRRHEVPLVQRLEHVDGVNHAHRVRVGEFLHEGLDGRELRSAQAQFFGFDHPGRDAAAERGQVAALGAKRDEIPDDGQAGTDEAELIPREREAPRLDQHEHQQGGDAARQAIDRDVDKRFDFLPQLRRQREEQHFAGRLVDGVTDGLVHRRARRPGPRGPCSSGRAPAVAARLVGRMRSANPMPRY